MPCYHPVPATATWEKSPNGWRKRMQLRPAGEPTHWLPCGTCIGCREMQQQHLAIRVAHESHYHCHNQFLTLTYDENNVPNGLQKRDLQLFWKRLRKLTNQKLKYLACGEYGDRTQRPHYHAATLGLEVTDQRKYDTENATSETLTQAWGHGRALIAPLTPDRIRYVAGYVMKKAGYRRQLYCDPDGVELEPPFRLMSTGLGKKWVEQYATDLRHGRLTHENANYTIPRYYTEKIKQTNQKLTERIENEKQQHREKQKPPDKRRLKDAERIREMEIRKHTRDRI